MRYSFFRGMQFVFLLGAALVVPHAGIAGENPDSAGPVPHIGKTINDANYVVLWGNLHPAATASADRGKADDSLFLEHMVLVLKRSDSQRVALQKYLDDQHNPRSSDYHRWLTPEEYGARFGVAAGDMEKIMAWLASHGFSVEPPAKGRNFLLFSGTNAQLREAFHTEMHKYLVNGETHFANAANPAIPAALSPVVAGISKLNDFPIRPLHQALGLVTRTAEGGKWKRLGDAKNPAGVLPLFDTTISGTTFYAVSPYDFTTIYNVLPLWNSGINGTGQTIALVGRTDINTADMDAFRAYFGLPATKLNIMLVGADPGFVPGDEGEADLDVEWAGAVARNATIDYVIAASTTSTDGLQLSAEYIVDNNLAPVMSVSYGECELALGVSGNQFWNELWQQAAAQGITVLVASGDAGAAGCDQGNTLSLSGLAVNGLASTPYNVAVGGTDLYGTYTNAAAYWNTSNDPTTKQSAKSYMPELPWNNSCGNPQVLAAYQAIGYTDKTTIELCNDSALYSIVDNTVAGGGGASNCTTSDGSTVASCAGGYAKPAWQTVVAGVPTDGVRDLPDISLFAGSGLWGSFNVFCESDATPDGKCNFDSGDDVQYLAAGGTSFAAPAFAGIAALLNQKEGTRLGNLNQVLYKLAASEYANPSSTAACDSATVSAGSACSLYDITTGSNNVPCYVLFAPNCTVEDPSDFAGLLSGWDAASGYDLATGLGSINAYNLANAWAAASAEQIGTSTTLVLDATTVPYGGLAGTITVVAASGQTGTPGGDASLISRAGSAGVGQGPFTLSSGQTHFSASTIPVGSYNISAHYGGDATFAASSSAAQRISVTKAATSLSVQASRAGLTAGENVTFTAVIATNSKASSPSGTVVFTDTTTGVTLGSAAINASTDTNGYAIGRASIYIQSQALNQGSNAIQAAYNGDSNYLSAIPVTTFVTYTPPFTLSVSPSTISMKTDSSGTATITLAATGKPLSAPVALACPAMLASGLSCTFTPSTIAAGSTTATSVLTLAAAFPLARSGGMHARHSESGGLGKSGGKTFAACALFVLTALFGGRRRTSATSCLALLCLACLLACGGEATEPTATTTTLSVTPTSVSQGSTATFKASVLPSHGSGNPTGSVVFFDGSSILGTSALQGGSASFSTNFLSLGRHSIIATYSGDRRYLSSSATAATVDVTYNFSLVVAGSDTLGNKTMVFIPVSVE
jgi:subtilase family serine protease